MATLQYQVDELVPGVPALFVDGNKIYQTYNLLESETTVAVDTNGEVVTKDFDLVIPPDVTQYDGRFVFQVRTEKITNPELLVNATVEVHLDGSAIVGANISIQARNGKLWIIGDEIADLQPGLYTLVLKLDVANTTPVKIFQPKFLIRDAS